MIQQLVSFIQCFIKNIHLQTTPPTPQLPKLDLELGSLQMEPKDLYCRKSPDVEKYCCRAQFLTWGQEQRRLVSLFCMSPELGFSILLSSCSFENPSEFWAQFNHSFQSLTLLRVSTFFRSFYGHFSGKCLGAVSLTPNQLPV